MCTAQSELQSSTARCEETQWGSANGAVLAGPAMPWRTLCLFSQEEAPCGVGLISFGKRHRCLIAMCCIAGYQHWGRHCSWGSSANTAGGPRGLGRVGDLCSVQREVLPNGGVIKPTDEQRSLLQILLPVLHSRGPTRRLWQNASLNSPVKCWELLGEFRQLPGWVTWRRAGSPSLGQQGNSKWKCVLGQFSHAIPDTVRWDGPEWKAHQGFCVVPSVRRLGSVDGPSAYCLTPPLGTVQSRTGRKISVSGLLYWRQRSGQRGTCIHTNTLSISFYKTHSRQHGFWPFPAAVTNA